MSPGLANVVIDREWLQVDDAFPVPRITDVNARRRPPLADIFTAHSLMILPLEFDQAAHRPGDNHAIHRSFAMAANTRFFPLRGVELNGIVLRLFGTF